MTQLLTEKEVAILLKVSLQTLRRWRHVKSGPKFIKLGSSVRYRDCDVELFLDEASRDKDNFS